MYKDIELFFEGVAPINEEIAYGASANFNGLFEIHLKTGKCTFIRLFENERPDMDRLFFSACKRDNYIYFIPNTAVNIHRYDLSTKALKIIPLDFCNKKKFNLSMKFCDAFVYKGNVIIIGAACPYILILDQNDEIKFIELPTEERLLFRRGAICNEKYYIKSNVSRLLLEYDLKNMRAVFHQIPENVANSWNVSCLDHNIFFVPDGKLSNISYYDTEKEIFEYIDPVEKGSYISFNGNDKIIAIPIKKNPCCVITRSLEVCEKSPGIEMEDDEFLGYAFETQDHIYLIKTKDGIYPREQTGTTSLKIDKKTFEETSIRFVLFNRAEEFETQIKQALEKYYTSNVARERPGSLRRFLNTITR